MPTKHALGVGSGKIIEYEDGTAAYVPTGKFTQAFRVKIADVTGFSVTKGGKMLERTINVDRAVVPLPSPVRPEPARNHGAYHDPRATAGGCNGRR